MQLSLRPAGQSPRITNVTELCQANQTSSAEFKVETEDKHCIAIAREIIEAEPEHHLKYAASIMGLFTHLHLCNRKWPVTRSQGSSKVGGLHVFTGSESDPGHVSACRVT